LQAFFSNLSTNIHGFGAKGWWQSLVVLVGMTIIGNVADHYLGVGNAVSKEVATISAPAVSPTTVQ
jgi:hypothetical protein